MPSDEWDEKAREMDYALSDYAGIFGAPISPDDFKKLTAFRVAMTAAERRGIERAAKVKVSMTNYEDEFGSVARVVSVSAEEAVDRMRAAIRALAQPAGASDKEGTGP